MAADIFEEDIRELFELGGTHAMYFAEVPRVSGTRSAMSISVRSEKIT